ncbi:acyl carrier protein [Streptomyces sp. SCA3-4]|uniref:acyl carrier protein n=1 Tax=Streptomyces sichuanensis TaxID=2871810 RepID=UPI001CE33858|nr:acyl carrier protein [Streptomyces sichuanensis]MCA6091927.1 acyl carrier protein [Streptomyces sichuanensis]
MATPITLDELLRVLATCGAELQEAGDDAGDAPFAELGLDSLALLEVEAVLRNSHGTELPDDFLGRVHTPNEFVRELDALSQEVS